MPNRIGPERLRLMYYCHDTYGLGHLRRTMAISREVSARGPAASQLIVTGSPVAHDFLLAEDADYVKLPSVIKLGAEHYAPRSLGTDFESVRALRSAILSDTARHYRPHVLVVDHSPAGMKGEIVPTLKALKAGGGTRLVLGLRDIVDEPDWVREVWTQNGIYHLLDEVYDRILVYGQRNVFDVAAQYGLSPRAAAKLRYVGYLRRPSPLRTREMVRRDLGMRDERLVVVTAGGGGDGFALFETLLAALDATPPKGFRCVLVGGPLMPAHQHEALAQGAKRRVGVQYLPADNDMTSLVAAADLVVSMGGYNSVCEVLSYERRAIIVPRVLPRREQILRAEAFSRRGWLQTLHPASLSPERLRAALDEGLARRPRPLFGLDFGGLGGAAQQLLSLAQDAARARAVAARPVASEPPAVRAARVAQAALVPASSGEPR